MVLDTSYSYTFASYLALVGAGVAVYFLYRNTRRKVSPSIQKAPRVPQQQQQQQQTDGPRDAKTRKHRGDAYASESREAAAAAAAGKKTKSKAKNKHEKHEKEATSEYQRSANAADDSSDDGVDDKEFARQLTSKKEGQKFDFRSSSEATRQRSVKQSRASKVADFDEAKMSVPSAPSSTTGAEADDDQSSAASPAVGPVDSTGVADMVEPAPAGLSVLRLTNTSDSGKSKRTNRPAKEPQQAETKKQRQNKKKAEAAKAAREEAEKERKVKLEEQRRTARIAEGKPAKDGSQFLASVNGTKKNSWHDGAPNGTSGSNGSNGINGNSANVELLDTFEPEKSVPATAVPAAAAESVPTPAATQSKPDSWMSALPSEEEQLEMLKKELEWSTVKSKSSKRSMKKEKEAQPLTSSEDVVEAVQTAAQPTSISKPVKNGDNAGEKSMGSFAALRTEDAPVLVEEEWDV